MLFSSSWRVVNQMTSEEVLLLLSPPPPFSISSPLHRRCSQGYGVAWIFTIAPQVPAVVFNRPVPLLTDTKRPEVSSLRSRSPSFRNPSRHSTELYVLGARRGSSTRVIFIRNVAGDPLGYGRGYRKRRGLAISISVGGVCTGSAGGAVGVRHGGSRMRTYKL